MPLSVQANMVRVSTTFAFVCRTAGAIWSGWVLRMTRPWGLQITKASTCRRFRPFDVQFDRSLELWELPLIVMDATLNRYRGLTPMQGKERILELARRCMSVGGTLTLLWHNSSFNDSWGPWGQMYSEVLKDLSDMVSSLA